MALRAIKILTCSYNCSDGIGRTGTFMTIYSQIERAKSEGVVDVFQFIRGARMQRFGLVRSEVSFEVCACQ